jgi:hypothetical protein
MLSLETVPKPHGFDHQRQFPGIAAHLADPAPIAARLLAGEDSLFAERDRDAALREEPGAADAHDAAADDDDIDGARRTHIGLASIEGWTRISRC